MVHRKSELSPATIDRGWPHQVALPAAAPLGAGYAIVRGFCADLSPCVRGHSVYRDGGWFSVLCFASGQMKPAGRYQIGCALPLIVPERA
jgi:hypothetical protein